MRGISLKKTLDEIQTHDILIMRRVLFSRATATDKDNRLLILFSFISWKKKDPQSLRS